MRTVGRKKYQTAIWLDKDVADILKTQAKKHGRSMAEEIRLRLRHSVSTVSELALKIVLV